jgi:NAD(P)-dependent dehydrogenase (short-subunit alcohol dehydrogenase family)
VNLELADDVAVVVGGASGIGLAVATTFANEGARVVILDRDPQAPDVAARLAEGTGRPALGIVADIVNFEGVQSAAKLILSTFGRCDHVVHAAAIGSGKYGFPFWNLQPQDWPRVLEVNLVGAVNVAHAFAPYFVAARCGTLLFISSVAGQIGSQTDPPYSASKAGLINFAQCAAKDLAPYQVRVNTVCPGMIKTRLNQSVWEAWNSQQPSESQTSYENWADEKVRRVVPLQRWQEAEDIAQFAVFLASDRAKNITGQTLNVDGGQVMHW